MSDRILRISDDFLNIRGTFRVGGVIDVGTHASLVRRANGKFVFLDSYCPQRAVQKEIDALTDGGRRVDAVLNLHPYHTVHVRAMHARYPRARLYGTERHHALFPDLPWRKARTEQPRLHKLFAADFDFSVPKGVDFVSANENVHFSSVLAFHRASKSIHVDDTLMYLRLPRPARLLGFEDLLQFHPTLRLALQKRDGARAEFLEWAENLARRWRNARNLCAAHNGALLEQDNQGASIRDRMLAAVAWAERLVL